MPDGWFPSVRQAPHSLHTVSDVTRTYIHVTSTLPDNMHSHIAAPGLNSYVKSKSKLHCVWRSVSQLVNLSVEPHLGPMTRCLLLFDSYGFVFVGRPLWRENGSVFCICCWPLTAHDRYVKGIQKFILYLIKQDAKKTYEGVKLALHGFPALALDSKWVVRFTSRLR
jgi:hypothetical protein